jgi:transcriptional regulator with XRE-family HTH domain
MAWRGKAGMVTGTEFKTRRKQLGLSIAACAVKLGVSARTIARLQNLKELPVWAENLARTLKRKD